MTIEELNTNLANVIADLQGEPYANVMVQIASDALYLIKDRVINRGESTTGRKMRPYSVSPLKRQKKDMTLSAYNKIAGSKQKRSQLSWVTEPDGQVFFILPRGYKQFRELHGRQTRHVDYTFTGRMWNNIKLQPDKSNLKGGKAVIGASTPEERHKIANNIELRGIFLKPTQPDIEVLKQTFSNGIMNIFKKNGITMTI